MSTGVGPSWAIIIPEFAWPSLRIPTGRYAAYGAELWHEGLRAASDDCLAVMHGLRSNETQRVSVFARAAETRWWRGPCPTRCRTHGARRMAHCVVRVGATRRLPGPSARWPSGRPCGARASAQGGARAHVRGLPAPSRWLGRGGALGTRRGSALEVDHPGGRSVRRHRIAQQESRAEQRKVQAPRIWPRCCS